MADVVAELNGLKSRLEKVRSESQNLAGKVAALKEQYAEKAKGLSRYGVKTVDELEAHVQKLDQEAKSHAAFAEKLLNLYEAGKYADVVREAKASHAG